MTDEPDVVEPVCPGCGSPPVLVMDGGHQMFCGDDDCHVFTWDGHVAVADADVSYIATDL
jgi:hypothetical protein